MSGGLMLAESVSEAADMSAVLAAMDSVLAFGGKILTYCVTNPVLCFCFAGGLVGVGVAVISGIKRFATSG